jgi:hypothetical protein
LPEDSFSLEAAILDTSLPFAIGAHEARQELRGAFGWPTFQVGLVEGVYFRFDPDGYARFSPTPRLDTDVFEVICRPRTHVCMGRKDSLSVTLSTSGQIQIKLENSAEGDSFFVSEGVSELPLPPTLLQPLDLRLEILLASGGDLVVRRGQNEAERLSLSGFSAVITYLRWVSARQDYSVMPRGWPVPNGGSSPSHAVLTQAGTWPSPMPQPGQGQAVADTSPIVAEVRGELNVLRELLLQQTQAVQADGAEQKPDADLLHTLQAITDQLARLSPVSSPPDPAPSPPVANSKSELAHQMATKLEYLIVEIGLEPDVALMVIQSMTSSGQPPPASDLLAEILSPSPDMTQTPVGEEEYQLLTDYFGRDWRGP